MWDGIIEAMQKKQETNRMSGGTEMAFLVIAVAIPLLALFFGGIWAFIVAAVLVAVALNLIFD